MKCKKLDFEQCVDKNIRRDKERSALVCEPAWHVAIVEEFVVPGPFKNGLVYTVVPMPEEEKASDQGRRN